LPNHLSWAFVYVVEQGNAKGCIDAAAGGMDQQPVKQGSFPVGRVIG
jgi:hypothetical protein